MVGPTPRHLPVFDVASRSSFGSISTFHLRDLAQGYLLPRNPKSYGLASPVSLLLVGLKADASAAGGPAAKRRAGR